MILLNQDMKSESDLRFITHHREDGNKYDILINASHFPLSFFFLTLRHNNRNYAIRYKTRHKGIDI